jgi:two-component system, OmpR family, response regulator VanR
VDCLRQTKKPLSILLVEDDTAATAITVRLIAMQFPDALVCSAENGNAALQLFKEQVPDIVITDIGMPLRDGMDMAREIRKLNARTRFIVLTAYNEKQFIETFDEIGVDAYLLKPLNLDLLMSAIEKSMAALQPVTDPD